MSANNKLPLEQHAQILDHCTFLSSGTRRELSCGVSELCFKAQCILTPFSSRRGGPVFVDNPVPEHRPQDVDPATSQGDHGLLGGLALGALSSVVCPTGFVAGDRAERRSDKYSFDKCPWHLAPTSDKRVRLAVAGGALVFLSAGYGLPKLDFRRRSRSEEEKRDKARAEWRAWSEPRKQSNPTTDTNADEEGGT